MSLLDKDFADMTTREKVIDFIDHLVDQCQFNLNDVEEECYNRIKEALHQNSYAESPWGDSKKWEMGKWYPRPVGTMWLDPPHTYLEGYDIFMLEYPPGHALFGDITPPPGVSGGPFNFRRAVELCEAYNGKKFEELGDRSGST